MSQIELNQNRVNEIINILFSSILDKEKKLPNFIYKSPIVTVGFLTDSYFILSFLDKENAEKSKLFREKGFNPFPFLIKPKNISAKSIVSVDHAIDGHFQNTKFINAYSFDLGKDSTFILQNHTVRVESKELGRIEYIINLAYVISFGDNINFVNFYDYLENLVFYSMNLWGSQA